MDWRNLEGLFESVRGAWEVPFKSKSQKEILYHLISWHPIPIVIHNFYVIGIDRVRVVLGLQFTVTGQPVLQSLESDFLSVNNSDKGQSYREINRKAKDLKVQVPQPSLAR
jgi:hypothetical protein